MAKVSGMLDEEREGKRGHTGTDTFPNIDLFAFGVPYTTLRAEWPKDVEFPYAGGVGDKAWHLGRNGFKWGEGEGGAEGWGRTRDEEGG